MHMISHPRARAYQYLWQAFPQLIRDHCSTKKYISGPSPCRICIAQLAHLASGDLCLSDWHLLPGQDPTWHEQTPFGTFATGLTYTTIELHATGPISIQTRHQPYLIKRYLQAELCGWEVFDLEQFSSRAATAEHGHIYLHISTVG